MLSSPLWAPCCRSAKKSDYRVPAFKSDLLGLCLCCRLVWERLLILEHRVGHQAAVEVDEQGGLGDPPLNLRAADSLVACPLLHRVLWPNWLTLLSAASPPRP
ncbi:hypothetical protein NDU88_004158 [Pleurodeles waltl]|uniref:Uncharacterized protein n=1 Tax=Pleurodeles waltl TaxID=8319 RepID=A0AAV7UII3_PLEWA|nr:hypothetical protein NDU88_004158 [Pleurodeles waltl]